jgi:hypothetical protein
MSNKHRSKRARGNSSGDSSSKKMGLFGGSGDGVSSAANFIEGKHWYGVSPVCARMRDHFGLSIVGPSGGANPYKGNKDERLSID